MRIIFAFTFLVLGFVLSYCNDDGLVNPHYPAVPSIEFKKIEFIGTLSVGDVDTLKLTIKYRDGDSDLGFDNRSDVESEYPYNDVWFFLADGSGDTARVTTRPAYTTDGTQRFDFLISNPNTGKLAINKTREQPNYGYLPIYDPSNNCLNYSRTELLVAQADNVVDNNYNVIDTLLDSQGHKYLLVEDLFLYQRNENHYNILIEFYKSNDDGITFTEFDWFEDSCIDFNGRFPFLGHNTGTVNNVPFKIKRVNPWEGDIQYSMPNSSFLTIFGDEKMKLKIKIKDRALHTSNTIETPVFTLR